MDAGKSHHEGELASEYKQKRDLGINRCRQAYENTQTIQTPEQIPED